MCISSLLFTLFFHSSGGFKMPPVNKPSASNIPGENCFPERMVTAGLVQMLMQLHIKKKNKETLTGPEFSSQDWAHEEDWMDIFPKKGVTWLFYKAIMSPKYFTSRYFVLILCSSAAVLCHLWAFHVLVTWWNCETNRETFGRDDCSCLPAVLLPSSMSSTHFLFQFLILAVHLSFQTAEIY